MDVWEAARTAIAGGFAPIPVPARRKRPARNGWPDLRITSSDVQRYFRREDNVGLLNGSPSGDLIDIDLDVSEAVRLAGGILPKTKMRSGRENRPGSHHWYRARGGLEPRKFQDPTNKGCLLEIRSDGQQTLIPPSVHPDGDRYVWEGPGLEPAAVDPDQLVGRVERLAGATLLARHWPREQGSRHDIANALAGMLARAGWPSVGIEQFVERVARAARDPEARARRGAARATAAKVAAGQPVTGAPTLAKLLPATVVDTVRAWLGLTAFTAYDEGGEREGDTALTAYTAYANPEPIPWPDPLGDEAFHGLAGDFVRTVEPHTEADSAAVLIQFLVSFGSSIGRGVHFRVEGDEHHANLFAAVVGATAKGRKGTSWGQVRRLFKGIDEKWVAHSIVSGLSSGEGLIWAVRDEVLRLEPIKKGGVVKSYQEVIAHQGVDDKRLLVLESELASALRVVGREGNTLSPIVRSAWDTGTLRTLTKNSPAKATDAHISIIGHITRDELRRYLDRTEAGNGFGNRFIWICARRSKELPHGGNLEEGELELIKARLRLAVEFSRSVSSFEIGRDDAANHHWEAVYSALSRERSGLFGAVTSRAEAQVVRLSLVYALLDRSDEIRLEHLDAALAVWEYAEASARYIFGDALGDPLADEILQLLRSRPEGVTRNELREYFKRNKSKNQLDRALALLAENGLARTVREETDGRPAERWLAVQGYAVNAINAVSPPGEGGYRVNRVYRVADPGHGEPSDATPRSHPDPSDQDPGDDPDEVVRL